MHETFISNLANKQIPLFRFDHFRKANIRDMQSKWKAISDFVSISTSTSFKLRSSSFSSTCGYINKGLYQVAITVH